MVAKFAYWVSEKKYEDGEKIPLNSREVFKTFEKYTSLDLFHLDWLQILNLIKQDLYRNSMVQR